MNLHSRFPARAALAAATLLLVACTQGGFDAAAPDQTVAGGAVSDPSSPAYFNQTLGDRVFFEVDRSALTLLGEATLRDQAQWLLDNAEYTAAIEGHADERGTREYNLALGARRAAAVRDFLVGQGVADRRLSTISYGKERPVEICSRESCYRQNRRAVTVISAASGA